MINSITEESEVTLCANCGVRLYQVADPNNLHWHHAGTGDVRCPTRFAEPSRASVVAPNFDQLVSNVVFHAERNEWDKAAEILREGFAAATVSVSTPVSTGEKARYEVAHPSRYSMTHTVHPDIVVLWFLALKSHWFDDPDNVFYGMREQAKAYLYKWVETGELADDHTTLEIATAMKFREWLQSSWTAATSTTPDGEQEPLCPFEPGSENYWPATTPSATTSNNSEGFDDAARVSRVLNEVAATSEGEQERVCYWCKHQDHGNKVCPAPYLARGEGGLIGSYPCGCTRSTVLSDSASVPPSTTDTIRAAAKEIAGLSYARHREEKIAQYVAILSRWFGKGETELDPCAIAGFHVCGPKDTELREAVENYAAAPAAPSPADTCAWTLDDSNDGEIWETSCGQSFSFTDGGVEDNGFVFCYKCGKRIDPGKYSDSVEGESE